MQGSIRRTPFRLGQCIIRPADRLIVAEQGSVRLSSRAMSLLGLLADSPQSQVHRRQAAQQLACSEAELNQAAAELSHTLRSMAAAGAELLTNSHGVLILRSHHAARRRPEDLLFARTGPAPSRARALRRALPRATLAAVLLVTGLIQMRLTYLGAAAAEFSVAELLTALVVGIVFAAGVMLALAGLWQLCRDALAKRGPAVRGRYQRPVTPV